MTIRMLTSIAGEDICARPGDLLDLDEDVAASWIAHGLAATVEEVDEDTAPHTAEALPAPEKAVALPRRRK